LRDFATGRDSCYKKFTAEGGEAGAQNPGRKRKAKDLTQRAERKIEAKPPASQAQAGGRYKFNGKR
jgi:hypothetical protein